MSDEIRNIYYEIESGELLVFSVTAKGVSSSQARAMFICLEGNACKDGGSARGL
jgi:hypothetical protein